MTVHKADSEDIIATIKGQSLVPSVVGAKRETGTNGMHKPVLLALQMYFWQ